MKKAGFNPRTLFAASEPGAWYDPSDMSTLFQDSAGSTPVTAVGQPVGLLLDKSKGLVLGPELVTNTGGPFTATTGWSDQQGNAPLTVSGGNLVATPTSTGMSRTDAPIATVAGKWYTLTVNMIQFSGPGPTLAVLQTRSGSIVPEAPVGGTVGITTFKFLAVGSSVYLTFGSNVSVVGVASILSSVTIKEIPGNHARQATATARPVLQQDGNGKYYLAFDGMDDSMATAAINFTATDKMSVFAGVYFSDATGFDGVLELVGSATPGSLWVYGSGAALEAKTRGSGGVSNGLFVAVSGPSQSVYSMSFNLAGAAFSYCIALRKNGTTVTNVGSNTAGGGNYGTGPITVGSATGVLLTGRLYSLIIRGAQSSLSQIEATERYIKQKMGLP